MEGQTRRWRERGVHAQSKQWNSVGGVFLFHFRRASPAPRIRAGLRSDAAAARVERELLRSWRKTWQARDAAAFSKLFSNPKGSFLWNQGAVPTDFEGIRESAWDGVPAGRPKDIVASEAAARYLSIFSALDNPAISLRDIEVSADGARAKAAASVDVRGRLADGTRRHDRGLVALEIDLSSKRPLLISVKPHGMETLAAEKAGFEDATLSAGLAGFPVFPRAEALRRGGYALAVSDFDGDGRPDALVGGSGPAALYRNRGDGTFEDRTKAAGLSGQTKVKAALMADMNGDGRTDLVLQRFVDDEKRELLFYENAGEGKFKPAESEIVRKARHDRPMSMAAGDFDGDGRLDLYMGHPGVRDFTDPWTNSDPEVRHEAVYLNRGGWRFEEAEGSIPVNLSEPDRPHSEIAFDIDEDGRQDLIVVNDNGGESRIYMNSGNGKFAAAPESLGRLAKGWGMMAVAGDYLRAGRPGLYLTTIDLGAGHRLARIVSRSSSPGAGAPELSRLSSLTAGNRLYRPSGMGAGTFSYQDATEKSGVAWAGEAPAGAEWLDYNNDGRLDLYVANGLWSADPGRDLSSEFVRDFAAGGKGAAGGPDQVNRFMKGLQASGASFAGYQRNRLFRNNGDGTFTDVGYLLGVDRLEDGYVAAVADFDRDGRSDLLLRNADPAGNRWTYSPLTLLLNRTQSKNSVDLSLEREDGTPVFGARALARMGGRGESREVRSVQGAVQSEPSLHFGLGAAERIESLEINWPSGRKERFVDVPPGRYRLQEGKPLSASLRDGGAIGGRK